MFFWPIELRGKYGFLLRVLHPFRQSISPLTFLLAQFSFSLGLILGLDLLLPIAFFYE